MNDDLVVEAGETNMDWGYGVTITMTEENATLLLKSLLAVKSAKSKGKNPFNPLILSLKKVLDV